MTDHLSERCDERKYEPCIDSCAFVWDHDDMIAHLLMVVGYIKLTIFYAKP
jgi:hypothetical protein